VVCAKIVEMKGAIIGEKEGQNLRNLEERLSKVAF
jgi:hypothetical protein